MRPLAASQAEYAGFDSRHARTDMQADLPRTLPTGLTCGLAWPLKGDGRRGMCAVVEDAISIGGVDITDPDTYVAGMPHEAFRELRRRAPVAWHRVQGRTGISRSTATTNPRLRARARRDRAGDRSVVRVIEATWNSPRQGRAGALNTHIADMARQIVDDVVERGECDVVDARPLHRGGRRGSLAARLSGSRFPRRWGIRLR